MNLFVGTYPHAGMCAECLARRLCNACGTPLGSDRCTNGRCASCHRRHCTAGGATEPGHGFGVSGGPHFVDRGDA